MPRETDYLSQIPTGQRIEVNQALEGGTGEVSKLIVLAKNQNEEVIAGAESIAVGLGTPSHAGII